MTFFSIIFRGLMRRPVRTSLTLGGIAIGIAAVVALVGMSQGFEKSWSSGMEARGTDIVVNNMGTSLTPAPFPAEAGNRVAGLPNVAATSSLLVQFMGVEDAAMIIVSGRQWGGYEWDNLKVVSGRLPTDAAEPAAVLGRTAAEMLNKKVGDPLQIETQELTVVGIVDGGALVENGSVILSLPLLQAITGNENRINILDVRVKEGTTEPQIKELCAEIDRLVPEAKAMLAGGHMTNSQGFKFIKAMSWGTSLLAILVGVLGVMNTMLMTVFERTQEICILLAIGWKRARIVAMILCESALLGLLGGVLGVALGIGGVKILEKLPAIHGLLEPDLGAGLLAVSVGLAVLVGVVSGLYPAWRSSRMNPSHALHG